MGEIFVEGMGIVEIKGDTPDEKESRAILNAVRGLDLDLDPPPEKAPPIPEPEFGEVQGPVKGPLGLVSPEVRGGVREAVKSAPGILGFLAEMTPATIGTGIGATLGAPLGPAGVAGGGILGGIAGELLGQETGVSPTSETNLALAGAGPIAGRVIGGAARLAGRAGGKVIGALPPARVALGRTAIEKGTKELETLGARVLAQGKGLLSRPAKELYSAAERAGVKIVGKELNNTRKAMLELKDELLPFAEFPQVKGALGVIQKSAKTLSDVSDFNAFITVRRNIGIAVRAARNVAGIKLGSAKKLFAAMSRDLDDLAARQPTARAGKLAKAASARAKTEFAVRDVEGLIVRFTEDIGEGQLRINAKGLLKAMRALVDPKSKRFDKNFVNGLGGSLPDIMKNLSKLAGAAKAGSPGGPGSIVIRGVTAGGGAAIGSFVAGTPGAVVGALLGAGGPEILTGILMSKPAIAFLEAAARAGRGQVSRRAWMIAGQILTRSLGERQETAFSATSPFDLPGQK